MSLKCFRLWRNVLSVDNFCSIDALSLKGSKKEIFNNLFEIGFESQDMDRETTRQRDIETGGQSNRETK